MWSKMNVSCYSDISFNSPDEFILDVCLKNGYDVYELSKKTRKRQIVLPRQKILATCSVYSMKNKKDWSLNSIGKVLTQSHCMVLHAKKTICELIETNNPSISDIEDLSLRYWITREDFINYKKTYNL